MTVTTLSGEKPNIGVIGLGYVGLPLAVEFGKVFKTIGFDINQKRVEELKNKVDQTGEIDASEFSAAKHIEYSHELKDVSKCNVFIVTVPTPIDRFKRPDLTPLIAASKSVAQVIKKGDTVVFESTVYPGATEEVCVPLIEEGSGLNFNRDFFVGYSPERINPGDKEHRLINIKKVTSGSTPEAARFVDQLYRMIIVAGTHMAPTIRVAEAAKVIENTQRDLNIALMNELALIFDKLDINTSDVLAAAGTKWNFLPFKPGLVGGHCIGVDPYYLTHKAQEIGYHPELVLAGRRLNDWMAEYVAGKIVQKLIHAKQAVSGARILVLGLTFKPDCPDIRNSKIFDVIAELKEFGLEVSAFDPLADPDEIFTEYGIQPIAEIEGNWDSAFIAVDHSIFDSKEYNEKISRLENLITLTSILNGTN